MNSNLPSVGLFLTPSHKVRLPYRIRFRGHVLILESRKVFHGLRVVPVSFLVPVTFVCLHLCVRLDLLRQGARELFTGPKVGFPVPFGDFPHFVPSLDAVRRGQDTRYARLFLRSLSVFLTGHVSRVTLSGPGIRHYSLPTHALGKPSSFTWWLL